jgi:hypothetical protein
MWEEVGYQLPTWQLSSTSYAELTYPNPIKTGAGDIRVIVNKNTTSSQQKVRLTVNVKCKNKTYSTYKDIYLKGKSLTIPQPTASKGTYTGYVKISWDSVSGAAKYIIKRGTTSTYSSAMDLATVTSTSYNDSSAIAGQTYYYWVCPVNSSGTGYYNTTKYDTGYRAISNYPIDDDDNDNVTISGSISISYGYYSKYYLKVNGVTITDANAVKWDWLTYGVTIVPERNGYYLKISNNIKQLSNGTIKVIATYKGKKYTKSVTIKSGY